MIGREEISKFIRENQLENQVLSVHMAVRTLGKIEGGLDTLFDTFVAHGCTIMGPTHSWSFLLNETNGIKFNKKFTSFSDRAWDFQKIQMAFSDDVFDIKSTIADKELGFFSSYLANHPDRKRSNNPLGSFSAVGPKAEEIVWGENHFYHPLRKLVELGGKVVLMGVDVDKMTLIHSVKEKAGSQMLMRWVKSDDHEVSWVAGGGCSTGFYKLKPFLEPLANQTTLGEATVKIVDAREVENTLMPIIQQEASNFPTCDDAECKLCKEAETDFKPSDDTKFHIFEKEDTLWSLADKYEKSFDALSKKYHEGQLMAGKVIDLNVADKVYSFFEPKKKDANYHVVGEGENLYTIADDYKLEAEVLLSQFEDPTSIQVGYYVEIPS